jgi:hypothetical protein
MRFECAQHLSHSTFSPAEHLTALAKRDRDLSVDHARKRSGS